MPTPSWTRISVKPSAPSLRIAVSTAMFEQGAEGLHEDADAFVTHLPASQSADQLVEAVKQVDPAASTEVSALDDTDWSQKWKDRITAHSLGALTVTPPWLAKGRDPATTIIIEPAMAFGTGEHPTTRGVVRLMQRVIRGGERVADLGAGSAVLAIAAAKLGAGRCYAIEMDGDAIGNAEENVLRNDVHERVAVLEGDAALFLPLVGPVEVILANIISSVLIELLPLMAEHLAPGGAIILSGILGEERERMLTALRANGWTVEAEDAEEQWWSVLARRASPARAGAA